jgi:hypothetical protein
VFFKGVLRGSFSAKYRCLPYRAVYLCEKEDPEQKKIDAQNSPERGWAIKALPTNAIQTL